MTYCLNAGITNAKSTKSVVIAYLDIENFIMEYRTVS